MNATRLVIDVAREVVHGIDEYYDSYHADLINRFSDVLFTQQSVNGETAQRREINRIIVAFANAVEYRMVDKS